MMSARTLLFGGDRTVSIEPIELDEVGPRDVRLDTIVSAISAGTERLVFRGKVPEGLPKDPTIDELGGTFDFPVRYGYATVGVVTAVGDDLDQDWLGQRVFAFAPHQTEHVIDIADVMAIPDGMSAETASLVATMETAVDIVLTARPRLGERVVIFGAGSIGLSIVRLLESWPLEELVVVEPDPTRQQRARSMGADVVIAPREAAATVGDADPAGADLAIEVSGQPSALDTAIATTGYGARIVVGSWYGTMNAELDLGSEFHRNDLTITSSQVSQLHPDLRGRWTRDRRRRTALRQLAALDLDRLITHRIPFEQASTAYDRIDDPDGDAQQVLLTYSQEGTPDE